MRSERIVENRILLLPVQRDSAEAELLCTVRGVFRRVIRLRYAVDHVDFWSITVLPEAALGNALILETSSEGYRPDMVGFLSETSVLLREDPNLTRPVLHYCLPSGELGEIRYFRRKQDCFQIIFCALMYGTDQQQEMVLTAADVSLFHARLTEEEAGEKFPVSRITDDLIQGDVEEAVAFSDEINGRIVFFRSKRTGWPGYPFERLFGVPLLLPENGAEPMPHPVMRRLRTWIRRFHSSENGFTAQLRFCIYPDCWPNIRIGESTGTPTDITAQAYELFLELSGATSERVAISLPGCDLLWDRTGRCLFCNGYILPLADVEMLKLHMLLDNCCAEIFCGGRVLFVLFADSTDSKMESVDNAISGNLDRCKIRPRQIPSVCIRSNDGLHLDTKMTVYGLRGIEYSREAISELQKVEARQGTLLYEGERFRVYSGRVEDDAYGTPPAYAITDRLVVSPSRVLEEFEWRKTKWGDMTRVINHSDVWRADPAGDRYPKITVEHTSIAAAFRIAVDTFVQCSSRAFALPGQDDMWASGQFQGYGQGFGVWLRDSSHVALRCGNLIAPEMSLRTLRYALAGGFDNGCDGPAMAVVGLWDYYLATGDATALLDCRQVLERNVREMERRYDSDLHLVSAGQSTSNDAFEEPENGGFSLGSECYYMLAFEAMGAMGPLLGFSEERVRFWRQYAGDMKTAIRERYWNAKAGFFTSGPSGSEAFEKAFWETSGEEAAIWDKFEIATDAQAKSILRALDRKAMCPYGIRLFPDRPEHNHFCGPVWVVWEAGFASAAGKQNEQQLLWKLIAQQIRNCVLHKTFYEVLESDSGISWRWPGQLWHAAGFLSMFFYGLLGIRYREDGLTFTPCIPWQMEGLSVSCLRYRRATLHICTSGVGKLEEVRLDGKLVDRIPTNTTGEHEVKLTRTNRRL
jgi:hypothetical protein